MNLSLCTISLRHSLVSFGQVVEWAAQRGFSGIELWGAHAVNLRDQAGHEFERLRSHGLRVPMLSDYLPVQGEHEAMIGKTLDLCRIANGWGAGKLRTFAGNKGSHEVSGEERREWTRRMHELCGIVEDHGLTLIVETHPQTLADTRESTLRLIEEIDHPALRLNFDVIHVWESGADPFKFISEVEPLVAHMHLKNVRSRSFLPEFQPANVYAPAGSRSGMVNLFDGAFDYRKFLSFVMAGTSLWPTLDASLEWFGPDVLATLEQDAEQLFLLEAETLGLAALRESGAATL
ncbi:MAG: sugar phosphate isomerase/epimerase [Verrucomicrobiaceae bacterium]|nr:MAG: sugar phosphate isomerase/epimerase [Verrucomicrobiaceae bacterium]